MTSIITVEILKALLYLFAAGVIFFIWKLARESARGRNTKKVLLKGFFVCTFLALAVSFTLGSPSCIDMDPVTKACYEYGDDGYEVSNEERSASFAFFITLLFVPTVLGVLKGRKELVTGEEWINEKT